MSVGDRGVPLSQLRCPTCGEPFKRDVHYQPDEDIFTTSLRPRAIVTSRPPYIVCKSGHGWTLKTLYRAERREEEVLLDRYIGDYGMQS